MSGMRKGEVPPEVPASEASRPPVSWITPNRQAEGRKSEKLTLKQRGARAHPGSGSGRIEFDGSTETQLIECKDANRSFTIKGAYIERLWRTAIKQRRQPIMVVYFSDIDLTVEMTIKKGRH